MADTNGLIAGLLRDLASIQESTPSRWGYNRAAAAIFGLEQPVESLVESDGALTKVPGVGPKSARVVLEVLETGASPTVERAVSESGKAGEVEVHRGLRSHFLSRAGVVAVLADRALSGPTLGDYRGDFQMHSVWSDGAETLEAMAAAALQRGYRCCAVTDHSYGLRVARGVSMSDLEKQHQEIERINRDYGDRFRMIKGIEANIDLDGSIDMTPDELNRLELVVAAPHSALRKAADQTARMKKVVQTPGVHILGHPRGRMSGVRAGVNADWDEVFAAAADTGVAIEIDGDPSRQDIDYELARRALLAGCLFALDSDAHSTRQLQYAETAIAHARLAGVPADRIVNCWALDRLVEWLEHRRAG